MTDFKFIQTRDIWRRFPDNNYLHSKFNWFLKEIKKLRGTYFDDATSFCEYLPYEINYVKEFFMILYQLKVISEDNTVQEVWVNGNIDLIDSHKDVINIVNNEIELKIYARKKKLEKLKDAKK